MLLFYVISGAFSLFSDITITSQLTSSPILPPQTWQPSKIQLDSNHVDQASLVSLYFNLNFKVIGLANSYTEILFPNSSVPIFCSLNLIDAGRDDWTASCPYSPPAVGLYGPVHLRIKSAKNGQVLAEDTAFGYFAVLSAQPDVEDEGVQVTYILKNPGDLIYAQQEVSLNFSFFIWADTSPGDYFTLKIDSRFSLNLETFSVNFNGTAGYSWSYFDPKAMLVYLFGFNQGLSAGTQGVNCYFSLTGLTTPGFAVSSNTYKWVLKAWRYGTPTLIKYATGVGPNQNVLPGVVSVISFAPYSQNLRNFIAVEMTTYTKLDLVVETSVPAGGSINVEVFKVNYCKYLSDTDPLQGSSSGPGSGSQGKCSLYMQNSLGIIANCYVQDGDDSSVVNCTTLYDIPAKQVISIYALTYITGPVLTVSSVVVQDFTKNIIDVLDSPYQTILQLCTLLNLNFYISDANNVNTGINNIGLSGNYGLLITVVPPSNLIPGDSISLYMPVSKYAYRTSNYIGMTSAVYGQYSKNLGPNVLANGNKIFIGPGMIRITFEANFNSGDIITYFIGAGSSNNPGSIYLPLRPTHWSDFAESIAIIQKSGTTYIYAQPFYLTTNTNDLALSIIPFCNNVFVAGMPLQISFSLPYDYEIGQITVTFQFNRDLQSSTGLFVGNYSASTGLKVMLVSSDSLQVNISSIYQSQNYQFTIPFPAVSSSLTVTATAQLLISSNLVSIFSKQTTYTPNNAEISYTTAQTTSLQANQNTPLSFSISPIGGSPQQTLRFAFILPSGFSVSQGTLNYIQSSGFYLFSTGFSFKTVSTSDTNTFTQTVTAPWFSLGTSQTITFVAAIGQDFGNQVCITGQKQQFTVNPINMTDPNFSPTTQTGLSLSTAFTVLSLQLNNILVVQPGSFVSFQIGSNWGRYLIPSQTSATLGGVQLYGSVLNGIWSSTQTNNTLAGPLIIRALVALPAISNTTSVSERKYNGFSQVTINYPAAVYGSSDSYTSYQWNENGNDPNFVVFSLMTPGYLGPLPSNAVIWSFPNTLYSSSVYLGVRFTAPMDVPAGSTVVITANFSSDSSLYLNTWCNFKYSSVTLKGSTLTIVTSQFMNSGYIVQIVKDHALNLLNADFQKVLISLTVSGNTVVNDSLFVSNTTGFQVFDAPATVVANFTTAPSVKTAGFFSYFSFYLKLSDYVQDDCLVHILLNKDFNSQAGPGKQFNNTLNETFLEAYLYQGDSSKSLLCRTEHWVISCEFGSVFATSTEVSFKLYLKNPADASYFSVFITDLSGVPKVRPFYNFLSSASHFSSIFSGSINLISAYPTPSLFQDNTHNVTLSAYLNVTLTNSTVFSVVFPEPYDLSLTDSNLSSCVARTSTGLLISDSCVVDHNSVLFSVISSFSNFTLTPDYLTFFIVSGLQNPVSGLNRTSFKYEIRTEDFFSQQFELIKQDKLNGALTTDKTSIGNLNGAFGGFYTSLHDMLQVNNGQKLIVFPGIFKENISISTSSGSLFARSIVITGNVRGSNDLVLSDNGQYLVSSESPVAEFWVAAKPQVSMSFYVIDWSVQESSFSVQPYYTKPRPTIIEVNENITFDLSFSQDIIVPLNATSMPYTLSIAYQNEVISPYSYIKVLFNHSYADVNISFFPQILTISKGSNSGTVQFSCENCTLNNTYLFFAQVIGPCASSFTQNLSFEFIFEEVDSNLPEIELNLTNLTSNSLRVEVRSDITAQVTWCLVGEDRYIPKITTEAYLKSYISSYGKDSSSVLEIDKTKYLKALSQAYSYTGDYGEYINVVSNIGKNLYFVSQNLIDQDVSSILTDLSSLIPGTTYYFFAYADGFNGNSSTSANLTIQTQPLPPHGIVYLTSSPSEATLLNKIVSLLDIDQKRVVFQYSNSRRLATIQSFIVLSSITSQVSGYSLVSSYDTSVLSKALGANVTGVGNLTYDNYQPAKWELEPLWERNGEIFTINFTTNVDGILICEIEVDPDLGESISSIDVFYGDERNGNDNWVNKFEERVSGNQQTEFSLNFTGWPANLYQVTCIVCNDYPMLPQCSDIRNSTFNQTEALNFLLLVSVIWGLILV